MAESAGTRRVPLTTLQANVSRTPPDMSLLRPSIQTSVTGIRQVLRALEKGSKEIRKYLLDEVNVIYECKVCMNFFRSLANLTAHKRSFCPHNFEDVKHVYDTKAGMEAANLYTVMVQSEEVNAACLEPEWDLENYSPSLELLKDAGLISEIEEVPLINRLLPPGKQGLQSVVEKLAEKAAKEHKVEITKKVAMTQGICLEPIKQTKNAQFQSWTSGLEYQEVQKLTNRETTLAIGPNGKQLPRGDIKRSNSPTNSDSSKENMETGEDNNNLGNLTRYPCPICKQAFVTVNNVNKHLETEHNKSKEQYLKLNKAIRNNAYMIEKVDEEKIEKVPFRKTKQEDSLQLAYSVGLVDRNGVGMQVEVMPKARGRPKKNPLSDEAGDMVTGEFMCDNCGFSAVSDKGLCIHKGRCKRNSSVLTNGISREISLPRTDSESDDNEITFNMDKTSPPPSEGPERKRKRVELTSVPTNNGEMVWNSGQYECQVCGKAFKTPTFLLQHYVTPHFRSELSSEFRDVLLTKKCHICNNTFDKEGKLLMHLGATHRLVNKYIPGGVGPMMCRSSPTKKPQSSTIEDPLQKFLATAAAASLKSNPINDTSVPCDPEPEKSPVQPQDAPVIEVSPHVPLKRSPGRPPGSPNKPKAPQEPAKSPLETSSLSPCPEFICQCGFLSVSERGLNIHKGMNKCASPKGDKVVPEIVDEFME